VDVLELQPVVGSIVAPAHAAQVVAPPYDALTADQRAALAAGDPDAYLGALPPETATTSAAALDATLHRCRHHLDRLLGSDRYRSSPQPALLILALGAGEHRAVAVVGDVPVAAFTDGRVRPHEATHPDRVAQLARYLEVVGVASSPVAVTQRPHADVTAATVPTLATPPDVAFRDEAGLDVALWVVTDTARIDALRAALAAAGPAYIADGHHRAAAVSAHAAAHDLPPGHPGAQVLTAVLPSDHLTVTPFHRRVDGVGPTAPAHADDRDPTHADDRDDTRDRDDGDAEVARLLGRIRSVGFRVDPLPPGASTAGGPTAVAEPRVCHLAVGGVWYRVDGRSLPLPDDPVEALDVRLVDRLLLPALGAQPAAVTPVAHPLGAAALARPGAVGIALHPPAIDEVLRVADAGRHLPAKTTYVTPKLRSGLLVVPRRSDPARP
jgi:uncharacterized protein (DUF1015 family)